MTQTPQAESISLFFKNEQSDKEYHVHLKEKGVGWIVEIQYAKRGSGLRSALKTKDPLDFDKAKAAYDKIVQGQLKEGYTPSEGGQAYQDTPLEKQFTGVIPQLLNVIEEKDFDSILTDPNWMLEVKFDGQNLLLRKGATVEGINRTGILVAIPKAFDEALMSHPCTSCLIAGEWLGARFAAFDLLELNNVDLRGLPAQERKARLDQLVLQLPEETFIRVEAAFTEEAKRHMHDSVLDGGGEGVVAKRIDAPYTPGRPNSGGTQLKRKFVESATVKVIGHHATKRSVLVGTTNTQGVMVKRGWVTIPVNHEIPAVGAIAEVIYLYIAGVGGALYQPNYKGIRNDVGEEACVCSQLKIKAEVLLVAPKVRMRV